MSWIQSAFGSKISPIILFIIVLLAVVFFAAAILHLIIRFLLKQRSRQSYRLPEMYSGPFQRQLQHLFHLHDSGLDQAVIDALPVFVYSDIVGSKQPFDCAVCLCEFSEFDELRLLPICSHAFHIDCIDTWLLSNSTCPLCRGVILSAGFSFDNPVFTVHDSKENEDGSVGSSGFVGVPCVLRPWENDNGAVINEKRVFSVRLGKFRSTNTVPKQEIEAGESSNINLDARRCFSMGSLQYVVADLDLQVALCPSRRRSRDQEHGGGPVKGKDGPIRNFVRDGDNVDADEKRINNGAKGESFSISKIWLWSKKGRLPTSAHFAHPVHFSLPNPST